jgi:hypothetical protein
MNFPLIGQPGSWEAPPIYSVDLAERFQYKARMPQCNCTMMVLNAHGMHRDSASQISWHQP